MMKIDWFKYEENFDDLVGYYDYNMLSNYGRYLSNDEAENIITFLDVENNNVSLKEKGEYYRTENDFLSFFKSLYLTHDAILFNKKKKVPLERNYEEYMNAISYGIREEEEFVVLLPNERVAFFSTFELLVAVVFYLTVPDSINKLAKNNNLFLLPSNAIYP